MTYAPVSFNASVEVEGSPAGLDTTSTTALVLGLIVFGFLVVLLAYVIVKIQLNKRHIMKSSNCNMEHTILENDRRASTVSNLWLPPSARPRPSISDSTCNILAAEERRRSSTSVWLPYTSYSTSLPVGNNVSSGDQHRRASNVSLDVDSVKFTS